MEVGLPKDEPCEFNSLLLDPPFHAIAQISKIIEIGMLVTFSSLCKLHP
jgi:hypothetical protein